MISEIELTKMPAEREALLIEVGQATLAIVIRRPAEARAADVVIEAAKFYDTKLEAKAAIARRAWFLGGPKP